MEGRKRSGMLKKSVYNMRKRLVAFALAAAMVCTNVGADLNAAYGATSSSESVTFEMTGSQLVTAIEEAIENGNVISPGDLDFTNGDIAKFESLFYGEGKVLEVYPDPDGGSMDAELRVFVRLPEDADDMYMVTGDEEIIFLYVNNGEDTVSFSTTIYDDEGGKLKSTKAIRVKSFDDAFGEEEINYISKPRETIAPAEDNGPAKEESTAPTESETAAPEEGTTAAPEEGTTVAPDEGTTVAPEETTTAAEESSSEAPSERETDSTTEAEQTEPETTEAPEINEEKAQEPEALENEAAELEAAEPESTTGEPVATITRHYAPIVADNEEGGMPEQPKADAAEEHVEEPKETTEAEVETEEKEPETTEKASEPTEVTDAMDSTEATEETSTIVPDATTEAGEEDVNPSESTSAEETTTAPAEDEETTTAVETPAETESVQTGTPSEVTKTEVVEDGEKVNKADTNNLVGIGYCSTARVYTTTLNKLNVPIPEREVPTEYTLYINHILSTKFGRYHDEQEITLYDNDFVDGVYVIDPDEIAFQRDGLEVVTQALTVTQDSFISNGNIAAATIDYKVEDGWKAVPNYDMSYYQRSIYIGTFDDVSIVPDDTKLVVKINFLNEQGVPVEAPYAVEAEEHDEGTEKTYSVEYTLPEISGYEPRLEESNTDFIIEDGVLKNVHNFTEAGVITVDVIYIAGDTRYIVKHLYQTLDGTAYEEDTGKVQELHGKIDSLTEAMEIPTEGFTVQDIVQQKISANGTVVEVKYDRNDYTLLYDTTGGSYVPSVTEKFGTEVTLVRENNVPTRPGYTFDGWYLDEELTQKAGNTLTLESDIRVYAKWNGAIVGYKVVYLTENADDDNYSYAGTVDTLSAKAGTTVEANAYTTKPSGFDTQHFSFKESTSEIVAADGSTVITVKYSRNVYTITFEGTSSQGKAVLTCKETEHTHSLNGGCYRLDCDKKHLIHSISRGCYVLICSKSEHRHSEKSGCYTYEGAHGNLTITAKYGAFIGDQWNALVGPGTDFAGMSWDWKDGYQTNYQEIMPGENMSIKKHNNDGTTRKLYYYIEDPDGDIEYNGLLFSLHNNIVFDFDGSITYNEEFYDMSGRGYDRYASTVPAWHDGKMNGISSTSFPKNPINFYYTLHSYKLSLVNGDRLNEKYIPYLTDISGKLAKPDYNPLGDGTFEGWYLDPSFQQPYEGDMTMPKGLVLYAKWNPVTYPVIFKDSMDETNIFDTQNIPRGKTVNPFIPEKPGFIFKGWFNDKECTQAFDYATQINEPKEIYAKWETSTTTTYTVIFQTSDGTVIRKDETHSGKVGATVIVNAIKPEGEYSTFIPDAITKTHVLDPNPDNNVIIFIYSPVTDLSYKVQYKYGDVVVTETDEIHSEANYVKVTADMSQILPKGYKSADGQLYQWVTLSTGENIVVFNVEPATYSIEYDLKDGSMKAGEVNPATYVPIELTDEGILLFNPIKYGYTFTGWKLVTGTNPDNSHNPLATVIGKGSYGNLKFEAGYELDDTQTKELSYTVQHVVNGEVRDTFTEEATVQVLQPNLITRNRLLEADQKYEGYVKSGVVYKVNGTPVPEGANSIVNGLVLVVNYEEDATQTKDLSYTVQHVVNGEVRDTFTEEATVQVLQPDTLVRNETLEADQNYEGYAKSGVAYADGSAVEGSEIANGATIIVSYEIDATQTKDLSYTVQHVVNGEVRDTFTEESTVQVLQPDTLVRNETLEADQNYEGYVKSEVAYEDGSSVDGNEIASKSVLIVSYEVDKNGDKIPDKYQTIFKYESADLTKGTVSVTTEEVHTFRDIDGNFTEKTPISPDGATATAKDGNAFEYWIDTETKDPTSDMSILKSRQYLEDTTFTAYFDVDERGNAPDGNEPDGVPDKYETIFVYKSADVTKGTVDADPLKAEVHVFKDADGNYTEKTPVSPKGANAIALDGFAFDYWTDSEVNDYTPDMSKMKSNTYLVDTTFTAYFDVDEIGTEEPNTPDKVPDKYQIMFQYVSEDTNHGTVSGAVTEVKTIYEIVTGEDGNDHRELRPARPNANVTVSGIGSYSFNNWTDGSRSYANADEIKAAGFTQSTTFTAQFNYNGGGGGTGGGGGGTSGGTTGNRRYTSTPGGPGFTTITPEDVPLAPLPESPVDVTLIDDGEVPLAPLPKTGQTSMRTTLTMMLSGIFVAVTALSRKRKEEDS
ncbi:MAG: doubled motif LPXTG anchor domain-containing protein [Enterocloster clostridioformis]|uniref:doubled motif LPXTG anchor domain-containing protein n=1 Tax=Enterocloster clostridioformis TaxID=1531 RepID=UPI002A82A7E8|nr:doubled motif LPXTG anchor domain-containing protein [Enterocloster clostridioformis]MDY4765988.1 doubled motif LPXTG anchor domain-containing protein [Enterocloster clostridioformis]